MLETHSLDALARRVAQLEASVRAAQTSAAVDGQQAYARLFTQLAALQSALDQQQRAFQEFMAAHALQQSLAPQSTATAPPSPVQSTDLPPSPPPESASTAAATPLPPTPATASAPLSSPSPSPSRQMQDAATQTPLAQAPAVPPPQPPPVRTKIAPEETPTSTSTTPTINSNSTKPKQPSRLQRSSLDEGQRVSSSPLPPPPALSADKSSLPGSPAASSPLQSSRLGTPQAAASPSAAATAKPPTPASAPAQPPKPAETATPPASGSESGTLRERRAAFAARSAGLQGGGAVPNGGLRRQASTNRRGSLAIRAAHREMERAAAMAKAEALREQEEDGGVMAWIGMVLIVMGGIGALILGLVAMIMREGRETGAVTRVAGNFTA